MPVTYKNRQNKTYYLKQGKTKTGKPRYYFSMKKDGKLVNQIPDEYEIYEHPANAQVFLRKKRPQHITDLEKHLVSKYLKKLKTNRPYIVDVKDKTITIFECSHDPDEVRESFGRLLSLKSPSESKSLIQSIVDETSHYIPVLRFKLEDEKKRTFIANRFCFLGRIDDWIYLDGPESLDKLAKDSIKHLGQESFLS
jgi:hypothetical protein